MKHSDYLVHLQQLTLLLMPTQTRGKDGKPLPPRAWWPRLLAKAGVSEVVQGTDQGESLTWYELVLVHSKLLEYAQAQLEERVGEMPDKDGREVLASPVPAADLRKTPLSKEQEEARAHVHAKLERFEEEMKI